MTAKDLLDKARKKTETDLLADYHEGLNEWQFKDWVLHEKANGNYEREFKSNLFRNIKSIMREIRKNSSISDKERDQLIKDLEQAPEYKEKEKEIMMLFAKHFVKYKDVYLS